MDVFELIKRLYVVCVAAEIYFILYNLCRLHKQRRFVYCPSTSFLTHHYRNPKNTQCSKSIQLGSSVTSENCKDKTLCRKRIVNIWSICRKIILDLFLGRRHLHDPIIFFISLVATVEIKRRIRFDDSFPVTRECTKECLTIFC